MERERIQKLEQELVQRLEQDRTGNNLRSVVQEILYRVSTESVSKTGTLTILRNLRTNIHCVDILAELNRAVLDLRHSFFTFSSTTGRQRETGVPGNTESIRSNGSSVAYPIRSGYVACYRRKNRGVEGGRMHGIAHCNAA
jgi:hypothetical protein